jgi:hypothetical protein
MHKLFVGNKTCHFFIKTKNILSSKIILKNYSILNLKLKKIKLKNI